MLAPLLLVTGLLTVFFGGSVVWMVLHLSPDEGATWFAAGLLALLGCGSAIFASQTAARWWWSRRRPGVVVLTPAPSGAMATAVLRSRASLVMPWMGGLTLTVSCALLAIGTAGRWWWATFLLAVLTVLSSLRLLPLVLGRAAAGGIYLTPEGLETRWGVETAFVPWDAVVPLLPPGPPALLRTPGLRVTRSFRFQMPVDVTDHLHEPVVQVPSPYLTVDVYALQSLLRLGMHRPAARAQLGTPASLTWHIEPPTSAVG